ncbi:MAG: type II secretion system protein GspG [Spirochaetes bacterium]|jgi:general secretion pathway protein G|nr:type II secretion system protein GspG [Spirochaetota bacterium]
MNLDNNKTEFARLQINQIMTALDMYKIDKGEYPGTEEGLDSLKDYFSPREIPRDPWGGRYIYRMDLTGIKRYEVFSCGPDKTEGTEDDIIIWQLR